jgi:mRNA interferase YafO
VNVEITNVLKNALNSHTTNSELDSDLLCSLFAQWKLNGEYEHYYFGKDSAYSSPKVNGQKYLLRHVHLVPVRDTQQLSKWKKAWQFKSRKTSDRVLVYVSNNLSNDHLLIYILDEPSAHKVAKMETEKDMELMNYFAEVAQSFIEDGLIIA